MILEVQLVQQGKEQKKKKKVGMQEVKLSSLSEDTIVSMENPQNL